MFAAALPSLAAPRGAVQRSRSRALAAPVANYADWELHAPRKGDTCLSISRALACDISPKECISHKVVFYSGQAPADHASLPPNTCLVDVASCGVQTNEQFAALFEIDEHHQLWCMDLSDSVRIDGIPLMHGVRTLLAPGDVLDLSGQGKDLLFSVQRTCYAHA